MKYGIRSVAEVDLDVISANLRAVRSVVAPGRGIIAVVKGNAYGHGAVAVSHRLERDGVRWFAVSSVSEAVELRDAGIRSRILIISGILEHDFHAMVEFRLTPVLNSVEQVRCVQKFSQKQNRPLPFHLEIDSGLSRLGVLGQVDELIRVLAEGPFRNFEGVMTHFASADEPENPQTKDQTVRFTSWLRRLRVSGAVPRYVHAANSHAVALRPAVPGCNMVRVGSALYGLLSPACEVTSASMLDVRLALTWKAKVLQVKTLPAGARVGYGGTHVLANAQTIAVIAAGYADGVPYELSNAGSVVAGGQLAPILGRVSMDMTTIAVPERSLIRAGDDVVLIGSREGLSLGACDIATQAGIPCPRVTQGISNRVMRVYL